MSLTYNRQKERRLKRLAQNPEFQNANGEPDLKALAGAVQCSLDVARFVLTGDLPAPPKPPAPKKPAPKGDPLA